MKIGILSFFDNGNYGSELQAYALNTYLTQFGHEVRMCRFYDKGRISRRIRLFLDKAEISVMKSINDEYRSIYRERTKNSQKQRNISPELRNVISQFSKRHLKSTNLPRSSYSEKEFDCWICGSDQIWSALRMPFQKERFLTRINPEKKIAYAVSLGLDSIPSYWKRFAQKPISQFKHLAFREQSSCNYAKNMLGVASELVADPTILVGRGFWDNAIDNEKIREIESPYCLCYFLGEISEYVKSTIKKYSRGKRIVVLPYQKDAELLGGEYYSANPLEFVNLVRKADYVFTDSFHGTVFSILYNKEFFVFKRSHLPLISQTNRITNLLDLAGINERYVGSDMPDSLPEINYSEVNIRVDNYRKTSEKFLTNALNEVSKK